VKDTCAECNISRKGHKRCYCGMPNPLNSGTYHTIALGACEVFKETQEEVELWVGVQTEGRQMTWFSSGAGSPRSQN